MNRQIVTSTNEENINMPSLPTYLNNEFVKYYVDVGGVYEYIVGNKEPSEYIAREEQLLANPQD